MYERLFQLEEETLKTLASQKRLEILQLLKHGELSVSDMVAMLGLPQANLSQHLSLLRRLRLVNGRKRGLHVYYSLSDGRVASLIDMLRDLLKAHHTRDPEIAKLGMFDDRTVYPIVRDPVCGMRLSVAEASKSVKYGGREYYFCASGCRQKFKAQPSKYLGMLSKTARA